MKEFLRECFQKRMKLYPLPWQAKRDGQEQVTSLKESVVDWRSALCTLSLKSGCQETLPYS